MRGRTWVAVAAMGAGEGGMIRSNKLRASAHDAPYCFYCMRPNPNGDLLALAHSNELRHGRGASFKSHDIFGAILCKPCHDLADGRAGKLSEDDKREIIRFAHPGTLLWWIEQGLVTVAA